MKFTVAIDGPAAAGKGTLAKAIAARFGLRHLDTGLLYRATALRAQATGEAPEVAARQLDEDDLARPDLRSAEAGQLASQVATIPAVRAALLAFQRAVARAKGGAVLDGRDIGTVVCPDAEVKLYITASPEVRARRRWLELGGEAGPRDLSQVLADVLARDARDSTREAAPLKPASDAHVIDTSELSIDAAVAAAARIVAAALAETAKRHAQPDLAKNRADAGRDRRP